MPQRAGIPAAESTVRTVAVPELLAAQGEQRARLRRTLRGWCGRISTRRRTRSARPPTLRDGTVRTWSTWRHGSHTTTCARSAAWTDGCRRTPGKPLLAEHCDDELPPGDDVDREEAVVGIAGFGFGFALRYDAPVVDAISCSVPLPRPTGEHERRIAAVMREVRSKSESAVPFRGYGAPADCTRVTVYGRVWRVTSVGGTVNARTGCCPTGNQGPARPRPSSRRGQEGVGDPGPPAHQPAARSPQPAAREELGATRGACRYVLTNLLTSPAGHFIVRPPSAH
ncbi:UNVERIFIED_CONTAM: hypothetical protein RKD50_001298 [Streptomyces canus]